MLNDSGRSNATTKSLSGIMAILFPIWTIYITIIQSKE